MEPFYGTGLNHWTPDTMPLRRTTQLIGSEKQTLLAETRVLLIGVGGVGGYALEMIARCGVKHITVIDADYISVSNINRQLLADHTTVGTPKAELAAERISRISPKTEVVARVALVTPDSIDSLNLSSYDLVVDAIDAVPAKIALIEACCEAGVAIFSSMGAAGKLDPTQVRVAMLSQAHGCRLARKIRKTLRQHGVMQDIPVVFSPEQSSQVLSGNSTEENEPSFDTRRPLGTISYLPAQFGILLGYAVIRHLLDQAVAPASAS
ncbi:MAG: ThiF family adenylyltransferase [Trichlorobacter sp.]